MRSFILFFCFQSIAAPGPNIALKEYLEQVKAKHEGFLASKKIAEGAELEAQGSHLAYSWGAFANYQYLNDSKPTANPAFLGTNTRADGYSLGVSKLTDFGLQAKISYQINWTKLSGVNPAFISTPSAYDAKPLLEVTQSLWRNGFGKETRSEIEASESVSLSKSYGERFKMKAVLLVAESAYWRLAFAREAVLVQRENLERALKLKNYSSGKVKVALADKADLLQASAAVELRQLELALSVDEEKSASRNFNSLIGTEGDRVDLSLTDFSAETVKNIRPPVRTTRDDIKAAEQMVRAAVANYESYLQKTNPTFDLFASAALNGRNASFGTAVSGSLKTDSPTEAVGFRFSTPLDFGLIAESRQGMLKQKDGAILSLSRKQFETDREWEDLNDQLATAKSRLQLSESIEQIQKEKLNYERERHKRGRSTTYQILQFEQDYSASSFARLRTEAEILKIIAQMKMFGGET